MLALLALPPWTLQAQEARPVTLEQALEAALRDHPGRARQAAVEDGAEARVELARAGLLPQLEAALQANRATANVVRGATFPMRGLPSISGPIAAPALDAGAFGTVAGLSASWDVLGLLARAALADAALSDRDRERAGGDLVRLEVAFNVADAFLGALGRAEAVKAARANRERAAVFETAVRSLAEHDLRPGADLSRAEAEKALASTQLIRAQQAQVIAEIDLARAMGATGRAAPLAGDLLELPAAGAPEPARRHPALVQVDAAAAAARSRERGARYGFLPRVEIAAALWARGSGYAAAGGPAPALGGLAPDAPNWAAGLVVSWPALDTFAQVARARAASAEARAADAGRRELELQIASQLESARAVLEGAREVAANTPAALAAARAAEQQATARYRSGLAGVTEVADAQRLLAQAELDDATARIGVRAAMLLMARALGDLEPFVSEAKASTPGAR